MPSLAALPVILGVAQIAAAAAGVGASTYSAVDSANQQTKAEAQAKGAKFDQEAAIQDQKTLTDATAARDAAKASQTAGAAAAAGSAGGGATLGALGNYVLGGTKKTIG